MKREGFDDDAPALPGKTTAAAPKAEKPAEAATVKEDTPAEEANPAPPKKPRRVKVRF